MEISTEVSTEDVLLDVSIAAASQRQPTDRQTDPLPWV